MPHRPAAAFLLLTLLAALLPVGQGCRLCGRLGRCCCFDWKSAAARPAPHCAGQGGACSMGRNSARPAAFRAAQAQPERDAAFRSLSLADAPRPAARVAEARALFPSPFRPSPPAPPPRSLRLV
jgi:hypothetical protein